MALNPTDPQFPPDATTFTNRTVPTCPSTKIVDFLPGKYTDVDGLNTLTSSCGSSSTGPKIFYFHSGTYYFDFTGATNPVWTMGNPYAWIIAGERTWDTRPLPLDPSGLFTATASSTGISTTTNTFTSGTPGTSSDNNKYLIGGLDMPAGVQMRFIDAKHLNFVDPTKAFGVSGPGTFVLTDSSSHDAPCDRGGAAGGDHPGAEFIFGGTSQVHITNERFEICAPAVGTREQNAIFGVKTAVGSLAPQSGCVIAQVTNNPCMFFSADGKHGNDSPVSIMHGTIYAPAAALEFILKKYTYQAVSRGIIARTVSMDVYPNSAYSDPVIYSPDFGTVAGADREMLMTACEDGSVSSCTKPKLRALVRIRDHDDFNILSIGNKVTVESWTIVR
jgi:hypothetical protein